MPFPININDDCLMTTKKTMTTNAGTPVAENLEKRTNKSVCLPTSEKIDAFVYFVMSFVTVKVP